MQILPPNPSFQATQGSAFLFILAALPGAPELSRWAAQHLQ